MSFEKSHLAKCVACVGLCLTLAFPENAHAIRCRITLGPMSFGVYQPMTTTPVDVIGQFDVRCQAQPGSFSISIGPGISGDQLARVLSAGGTGTLNYNLFRNPSHTEIWGDGTPPTFVVTGSRTATGPPSFFNYSVYGRIFSRQAPNPGTYSDNLLVTVLF